MRRKSINLSIFLLLLVFNPASADNLFSYAELNLPYEYRKETSWKRIIADEAAWTELYKEMYLSTVNTGPGSADTLDIPVIDFDKYMVVAGGLGFRSTVAVELIVARVIETTAAVYIEAYELRPGTSCVVPMAVGWPTIGLLLNKSDKEIKVYLSTIVRECG